MALTPFLKKFDILPLGAVTGRSQSTFSTEKFSEPQPVRQSFLWVLKSVKLVEWGLFLSGYIAWICDALDFFAACSHSFLSFVSLSVPELSHEYDKTTRDITTSITLTLLLRSLGALIFGAVSDAYGRRYPLTLNLLLIALFSLTTAYSHEFSSFLASRALFGVAMGGVWGMAGATSLEILPAQLRGIGSGIMNAGYPVGYLIAGVLDFSLVPRVKVGYRALFYFAAAFSLFAAVFRLILPESPLFVEAKRKEGSQRKSTIQKMSIFLTRTIAMMKVHWRMFIYCSLVMAGLQFIGHGSQDLMLTFLEVSKGLSARQATIVVMLSNVGGIIGGLIGGSMSQYLGRKATMCLSMIFTGAMIPFYMLTTSFGALCASALLLQAGAWGAWGVVVIHLSELSPPEYRALFPGLAYQVGNMITSASAQIEATGAARSTKIVNGTPTPNYEKIQAILVGVATAFTFTILLLGPENYGRRFEDAGVVLKDMEIESEHSKGRTDDNKL